MDDRGEKIINMAREMLRSGMDVSAIAPEPEASEKSDAISFKVMCLATIITALSSSALTAWACETQRPLNHYEKTELAALIYYAARLKGSSEAALRHDVEDRLGIANFDDMTQSDFDTARRYLQNRIL